MNFLFRSFCFYLLATTTRITGVQHHSWFMQWWGNELWAVCLLTIPYPGTISEALLAAMFLLLSFRCGGYQDQ